MSDGSEFHSTIVEGKNDCLYDSILADENGFLQVKIDLFKKCRLYLQFCTGQFCTSTASCRSGALYRLCGATMDSKKQPSISLAGDVPMVPVALC